MIAKHKVKDLPVINFDSLTTAEKEELFQEAVKSRLEDDRPLTARDQKLLSQARRKAARGRPKVGAGSKRIQVTMEASLLDRVDKRAQELGMSRAGFLARAVRKMLGTAA